MFFYNLKKHEKDGSFTSMMFLFYLVPSHSRQVADCSPPPAVGSTRATEPDGLPHNGLLEGHPLPTHHRHHQHAVLWIVEGSPGDGMAHSWVTLWCQ